MSSAPPKIKILLILAKNCCKIETKTFPYFANSHEDESLCQQICFEESMWQITLVTFI